MVVTDNSVDQQVYAEQVALLYRNSFVGTAITLIVGGILATVQSLQLPLLKIVGWYVCLVLVTAFRLVLSYRYKYAAPLSQTSRVWERRFLLGAGLSGLVWGAAAIFLFPPEALVFQVFLAFVLGGMVAGAVAIFSARMAAFILFVLPIIGSIAVQFFINGGRMGAGMGILTLVFTGGMIITAKNSNRTIRTALTLRFDNQILMTEITQRQRIEKALRASEERFRDFAESAADWFWEMDADMKYTHMSDRLKEVTGLQQNQILGQSLQQLFRQHNNNPEVWDDLIKKLEAREPFENFEILWCSTNGLKRSLSLSGKPIFDPRNNFQGYRGVGRDVTKERRVLHAMAYQANHDALTGLVNRRQFIRRLENALSHSKRDGTPCVLCYLDLDEFKIVNDTAGHLAGDELLKQITGVLISRIRARDTLSRFGGDEFGLLLENCPLDTAVGIAETLLAALGEFQFTWEHRVFEIGVSIGVVAITPLTETAEQILNEADQACYTAKDLGRNRVHVYREEDSALIHHHAGIMHVSELRKALKNDQFYLYYQPILKLAEHEGLYHFEVLLRLQKPSGEMILPGAFLPAAERYGIMLDIDRRVIEKALRGYRQTFGKNSHTTIGINLSGDSLIKGEMFDFIHQQLTTFKLNPETICFEITETTAIRNLELASQFITDLKATGFRFALDNIGSGFSSFTYLKHLPVDYLKIDKRVVREIANDSMERAMVAAINEIGHVMDMKTVAEGVETQALLKQLQELGLDYAQGYAVQKPHPTIKI